MSHFSKNSMIQPNEAKQDIKCKDNIEIDANQFLTEGGLDVDNEVSQRLIGKLNKHIQLHFCLAI